MNTDPVNKFFDAWGDPEAPNDRSTSCLTDVALVGIAKGTIQDKAALTHIVECTVCGSSVSVLKATMDDPGKNLNRLIQEVQDEAQQVLSKRHFIWKNFFSVRQLIPVAATAVVFLAILWGPLTKTLPVFNHNEANIVFDSDRVSSAMEDIRLASDIVSAPGISGEKRQNALHQAKAAVARVNSAPLGESQVELLNAQISNFQSAYTRAEMATWPKQTGSLTEADVYTTYERYKAVSQNSAGRPLIVPPINTEEAVQSATQEIKVTKTNGDIIIEPRKPHDFTSEPWLGDAMQNVADRNQTTVQFHSGQMMKSWVPRH